MLERESMPVMADDAALDFGDLVRLEIGAGRLTTGGRPRRAAGCAPRTNRA